ncbi:hypothetical protein LROSRS0_1524 [Furfurilactobacillus rossiae]|nr:hypothetical protein LROSRS0_1524 [Furfurilactobacillus rossiae]
MPLRFDDHQLKHQNKGVRDFHLSNDLVVVYYLVLNRKIIFIDVGPHSLVFNVKREFI